MPQLRDLVHLKPKRGLEFPHWVDRLLSVGIVSTDPQTVRCQRCVNIAAYATAATAVSHLISNSIHDFRGLLIINVYNLHFDRRRAAGALAASFRRACAAQSR